MAEYLAEKLDRPFVTNVVEIKEEGGALVSKKELDAGYHLVETGLPAILTISKPDYDPRYPTIKSKMAARKQKVPVLEIALDDAEKTAMIQYLGYQEPPKRAAGVKIQEDEAEAAVAKAFEIMAADKVL